jgi:hypothetical protein
MASNNLGELAPPEGWTKKYDYFDGEYRNFFTHADGTKQIADPGSKPFGVIALANVIPDMGALVKLDISSSSIGAEQERDLQRICVAGGIELTT